MKIINDDSSWKETRKKYHFQRSLDLYASSTTTVVVHVSRPRSLKGSKSRVSPSFLPEAADCAIHKITINSQGFSCCRGPRRSIVPHGCIIAEASRWVVPPIVNEMDPVLRGPAK